MHFSLCSGRCARWRYKRATWRDFCYSSCCVAHLHLTTFVWLALYDLQRLLALVLRRLEACSLLNTDALLPDYAALRITGYARTLSVDLPLLTHAVDCCDTADAAILPAYCPAVRLSCHFVASLQSCVRELLHFLFFLLPFTISL